MRGQAPMVETGKVLIAGNRGVGKTTLFSCLCEARPSDQGLAGYNGPVRTGTIRGGNGLRAIDTAGLCSILSRDSEESAARDRIMAEYLHCALVGIVFVADARNMNRSLALALQYAEFGLPMIMAVSMIDDAAALGIETDWESLSQTLGIEIRPFAARTGLLELTTRIGALPPPNRLVRFPRNIEGFFNITGKLIPEDTICPRVLGFFLLAGAPDMYRLLATQLGADMTGQLTGIAAACLQESPPSFIIQFEHLFHQKARQLTSLYQRRAAAGAPRRAVLGDVCTRLSTRFPIAGLVVALLYLFVGTFGAGYLADTIFHGPFERVIIPWITRIIAPISSPFVREMLVDPEFGVVPNGISQAIGLVLPVIFCFYCAFGILEDSGYLPRLSILLDRVFHRIGLNGRSVVPLVLGFSCVTTALLATRMLTSEKEKTITAFLLFLSFPCAPLIAVMFVILGNLPVSATITLCGLLAAQILGIGFVANRVLPGQRIPLLMEVTPLRMPRLLHILQNSARKSWGFMREAVPVFILASFGIFLFRRSE